VAAADAALFIPLGVPVPGLQTAPGLADPNSGTLQVLGRLRPGVGRGELAAALTTVTQRVLLEAGTPQAELYRARVAGFSPVPLAIRGGVTIFLGALLVVSGVLLLMTCISVAGMLLARATERHGELVVRRALGATRGRIAGQLMVESLVFFRLAGVMGAIAAAWLMPLLGTLRPPLPPGFSLDLDLSLDWRVVIWAALVAGVTGVLVSLPPALGASCPDLARGLREEGVASVPTRRRLRSVLVGVQMAATAFLLVVGGLFVRSLGNLDRLDPGWDPDEVAVARVDLELAGIDRAAGPVVYQQLRQRIAELPGVTDAAFVAKLPFSGQSSLGLVRAELDPPVADAGGSPAFFNRVTPGYFRTMGITLVRGRDIAESDRAESPPVAVVSAAMAQRLWPPGWRDSWG
jgi:predicted permease